MKLVGDSQSVLDPHEVECKRLGFTALARQATLNKTFESNDVACKRNQSMLWVDISRNEECIFELAVQRVI